MNATFKLCEEVKHWKEEARSWRAVAERLETEKQAAIGSADVRQAIARLLDRSAAAYGSPDYFGPDPDRATYSARHRAALKTADAILALLAANPPEPRQTETGWKGIASAPKDGSEVDLFKVGRHTGFYWDPEQCGSGAWSMIADRHRHWRDRRSIYAPTHFMRPPAPPPPAIGNLEGEGLSHG